MRTKFSKKNKGNAGATLVEIIVSFALLGIFMAAAAMIIATITNMYFNVKGETYSKQVSDIVLEKTASTIEEAKYDKNLTYSNPTVSNNYTRITLRDRTDTKVSIYAEDGEIRFFYAQISDEVDDSRNREATIWRFDDAVYQGYVVEKLYFVPGDKLAAFGKASDFGMSIDDFQCGNNVIVIFTELSSSKYGDFKTFRVVKMQYVPDTTE